MTVEKKKTLKKPTSKKAKQNSKLQLDLNKYAVYLQTISILLAIAALVLNLCDCISLNVMLDLFGLSVISLAFSLFPKSINR